MPSTAFWAPQTPPSTVVNTDAIESVASEAMFEGGLGGGGGIATLQSAPLHPAAHAHCQPAVQQRIAAACNGAWRGARRRLQCSERLLHVGQLRQERQEQRLREQRAIQQKARFRREHSVLRNNGATRVRLQNDVAAVRAAEQHAPVCAVIQWISTSLAHQRNRKEHQKVDNLHRWPSTDCEEVKRHPPTGSETVQAGVASARHDAARRSCCPAGGERAQRAAGVSESTADAAKNKTSAAGALARRSPDRPAP